MTRLRRLPARLLLSMLAAAPLSTLAPAREPADSAPIERLDPALDALIPPETKTERIAEGFDWSEGTVWDRAGGRLLFSDVPRNVVHRWTPDGGAAPFLMPSGYTGAVPRGGEPGSNGLTFDNDGSLILCQHGDRRVARLRPSGSFETLADRYEGKRLNSPNDVVVKSNGDVYFTDPIYGLLGENHDRDRELDFSGVYRRSADGRVTLLTRELANPNGLAFSPDEKTLYVGNSDPARAIWMAYPVADDGTLGPGRVFADMTSRVGKVPGLPDGLKVDEKGNVFATGPGGLLVFSPEGKHLGTIAIGVPCGNCAWGEDGGVLFVAADMFVVRIPTATRGVIPGSSKH